MRRIASKQQAEKQKVEVAQRSFSFHEFVRRTRTHVVNTSIFLTFTVWGSLIAVCVCVRVCVRVFVCVCIFLVSSKKYPIFRKGLMYTLKSDQLDFFSLLDFETGLLCAIALAVLELALYTRQ